MPFVDHFCNCIGILLASGLVFSDKLTEYSISAVLITYLAEKELNHAAILAGIQEALSALLQIVIVFISHEYFGPFSVISVSSVFSVIGLVLLYHGSRKSEKSRFDISGILLLSVGQAGVHPLLREFIVDQYGNHKPDQQNHIHFLAKYLINVWFHIVWAFSAVTALLIYKFSYSWPIFFIISAWATGISLILFLCSGVLDKMKRCNRGQGNNNRGQGNNPAPNNVNNGGQGDNPAPNNVKNGGKGNNLPPNNAEYFRRMVCMWTTFLLFGFVLSAGKIFFPYQGESMEYKAFLPLLVVIQSISRQIISFLSDLILNCVPKEQRQKAILVRICIGMLLSVPCFVVAWQVEVLRLRFLKEITLDDGTKISKSTKSIFSLVPQFCILGLMEGLARDGVDEFMLGMFPESRKDYVSAINTFVIGLGTLGTVLFYKIANSLFIGKENEHISPMDKYFIILTIVASVNFCWYLGISIIEAKRDNEQVPKGDNQQVAKRDNQQVAKRDNQQVDTNSGLERNTAGGGDPERQHS